MSSDQLDTRLSPFVKLFAKKKKHMSRVSWRKFSIISFLFRVLFRTRFLVSFVFTELDEILDRPQQVRSQRVRRDIEMTATSGDESDACLRKKYKVLPKKTCPKKKAWTSSELARSILTKSRDSKAKTRQILSTVSTWWVLVLTHRPYEILRHYLGSKHFAIDQWQTLETPGWKVLA